MKHFDRVMRMVDRLLYLFPYLREDDAYLWAYDILEYDR